MSDLEAQRQQGLARLVQRLDQDAAMARDWIKRKPAQAGYIWKLIHQPGPELCHADDNALEVVTMLAIVGLEYAASLAVSDEEENRT